MPRLTDPDNTFTMNSKTLYIVVAMTGVMWTALGGACVKMYGDLIDARAHSSSWEQSAEEAIKNLQSAADNKRAREGREAFVPRPAVVPESNSPATQEQAQTGRIATMRALMADLALDLGLPPRTGEHDKEGKP
jgi:hypothetical protein